MALERKCQCTIACNSLLFIVVQTEYLLNLKLNLIGAIYEEAKPKSGGRSSRQHKIEPARGLVFMFE